MWAPCCTRGFLNITCLPCSRNKPNQMPRSSPCKPKSLAVPASPNRTNVVSHGHTGLASDASTLTVWSLRESPWCKGRPRDRPHHVWRVCHLDASTHRPLSSSFLGLPYRILNMNHKQELLRGLWVVPAPTGLRSGLLNDSSQPLD